MAEGGVIADEMTSGDPYDDVNAMTSGDPYVSATDPTGVSDPVLRCANLLLAIRFGCAMGTAAVAPDTAELQSAQMSLPTVVAAAAAAAVGVAAMVGVAVAVAGAVGRMMLSKMLATAGCVQLASSKAISGDPGCEQLAVGLGAAAAGGDGGGEVVAKCNPSSVHSPGVQYPPSSRPGI
jgi:hypothetical protein